MLQRGNAIGPLLHYIKNSLSSPCTSLHKHEQKDRTKTLTEAPDHIYRVSQKTPKTIENGLLLEFQCLALN